MTFTSYPLSSRDACSRAALDTAAQSHEMKRQNFDGIDSLINWLHYFPRSVQCRLSTMNPLEEFLLGLLLLGGGVLERERGRLGPSLVDSALVREQKLRTGESVSAGRRADEENERGRTTQRPYTARAALGAAATFMLRS